MVTSSDSPEDDLKYSDIAEDAIKEHGGSIIYPNYNRTSQVYMNVGGRLAKIVKETGARVDPHTHSEYSNAIMDSTPTTNFLRVRECYASVKKKVRVWEKAGMNFITLQDHDTIDGYSDLLRYAKNKAFMSCEYTIAITPNSGKAIHIGVWGLDYPFQEKRRSPINEVRKLHRHLMGMRKSGFERFKQECDKYGMIAIFNHPPWQSTPENPMTGNELSDIVDAYDILEINGDGQKENLFTLELALERGKLMVAGSDHHNNRKPGIFTETLAPKSEVSEPWQFLRAVRGGEVGFGTTSKLPEWMQSANEFDVLRTGFNGGRLQMYKDIYAGFGSYVVKDWNVRKSGVFGSAGLLMGITSYLFPPILPFWLLAVAWPTLAMPIKHGMAEKRLVMKRTEELYQDYQNHLLVSRLEDLKEMKEEKTPEELNDLMREAKQFFDQRSQDFKDANFSKIKAWWERGAVALAPGNDNFYEPTYDWHERMNKESQE